MEDDKLLERGELEEFILLRLRAVFVNLVREQRADYRVLRAYIGHTSSDVLGQPSDSGGNEGMESEDRLDSHDLLNCLPTFGVSEGIWNAVWEQYVGHAPHTVATRHYVPRLVSVSGGEEQALAHQLGLFRLHVTEPLNRAIAAGRKRANVQLLYKSAVSTVGCAVQEESVSP